MIRNNKGTLIISSLLILLPILIGILLWNQLPESIATHWGLDGEADGWSSRTFAVVMLPLIMFMVHWLCVLVTVADPKRKNIEGKPFGMVLWICPLISLMAGTTIYATALGAELNINLFLPIIMGIMFVVIGNYLPKCKPNYTVGIKVPWTLNDEENWNHTHRFAGKVWVVGGLVVIATAFLEQPFIFLVFLLIMAVIPMLYSYLYYRKHQ